MDESVREFNLLDEKWIRVLGKDCSMQEISLIDVFENAHQYMDLAGEIAQQDIAMLRFLISVVYTVFWKYDRDGNYSEIDDENSALERWESIWEIKQFPINPIKQYLDYYRDRFWLFDEKNPFYQATTAKQGTKLPAAKLIGDIFESGNKVRFFSSRMDKEKENLNYSEAARWLLFINSFDDCAVKKPSPKMCYLSKLGLIAATGNNLFETLMLNLTFLKFGSELWEGKPKPIWELTEKRTDNNSEILPPDNLAELLTIQSRRLLLDREEKHVSGFYDMAGDYLEKTVSEQMTVWKAVKDKEGNVVEYAPSLHDSSKQMWRNFESMVTQENQVRPAGVISWISKLEREELLEENWRVKFKIVSVNYGSMNSGIISIFEDSLTVYAGLLADTEKWVQKRVFGELKICDKIADKIKMLVQNVAYASGADENTVKNQTKMQQERFYFAMDIPCRQWIASLNPESADFEIEDAIEEWRVIVKKVAYQIAEDIIRDVNFATVAGRYIDKKRYAAPEAYNRFLKEVGFICRT